MKNELNRRYLEFREREYEIDKLLEENMNEYLSKPKNEDFVYLDREYWEMLGYEPNEFQEMYPDHELPDFDELELEYDDYLNHLEKSLLNRIELYDKRMKNNGEHFALRYFIGKNLPYRTFQNQGPWVWREHACKDHR